MSEKTLASVSASLTESMINERIRLSERIADLEAQCAAMRVQLEAFAVTAESAVEHHRNKGKGGQHVPYLGDFDHIPPSSVARLEWWARAFRDALASEAGKAPLERLEKAEDQYAETTPDEISALKSAGPDVMIAEILRYRNMLGRAMTQRGQALEEAAKVAEAHQGFVSPIGPLHGAGWSGAAQHIAAAIRALAKEGT